MIRGILVVLALGLASPASAQTSCWEWGGTSGLFDWPAPPSVACRDRAIAAATVAPAPGFATPGTREPAPSARPADGPRLTFSGEAYIGVGRVFTAP